ncbi:MAG: alkaline phosphatase [Janthinobacterium lividum]
MKRSTVTSIALACVCLCTAISPAQRSLRETTNQDRTEILRAAIQGGKAKHVILFLGDGMGDSEITIGRNYRLGPNGRLAMDTLPLTGAYTTYALQESNPDVPNFVTDSAASGTGWATGVKTSNGRISTVAGSTNVAPLTTILELAQRAGFATGDVTTADLTDATPAVLASHVNDRGCYGPSDMRSCAVYKKSAGGPGSIAEQEVDHKVDVLMGGGYSRFAETNDGGQFAGQTVLAQATALGYQLIRTSSDLQNTAPNVPVLGLFAPINMDLEFGGIVAQPYPGSGPQTCTEGVRPGNQPSLEDMTKRALFLLDQSNKGKQTGFFLQVEGASIDKQDHVSSPCQQIGETIAFDAAIAAGLDYARQNPDTLVVVTADHGHTSQIIEPPTSPAQPGAFSAIRTRDNGTMVVSYASQPVGSSQSHTGTQVRIAAQGPQAANVLGVTNQTELFYLLGRALGVTQ